MYHHRHLLLIIFLTLYSSCSCSSFSPQHLPDHFFKSVPVPVPPEATTTPDDEYFEVTKPLQVVIPPSCSLLLFQQDFADTIGSPPASTLYSPPSDCPSPWAQVLLEFSASCAGEQYDRIVGIWLDGVEILRTSTAEPTESGIFWKVRKDVTRYSSLLLASNLILSVMLENVVNHVFTGIYHVNVSLMYYQNYIPPSPSPSPLPPPSPVKMQLQEEDFHLDPPADLIIPISDDYDDQGFWFRIQNESDTRFKEIQIPINTHRLVLEIYVSFHGNDEFWYSNPPNSYIELNNLTTARGNGAFRQVFVTIDGMFVGSVLPFPVIFTGGINPLFWEPVVAIGAFNLPSYDLDLSPFLGFLLDGKTHLIGLGVTDSISFWLVDANMHLWLDYLSPTVMAKSVINTTPPLSIKRKSKFKILDGKFKIKAERKTEFCGWVRSSAGNLTTYISQEFKFKNKIKFKNNGQLKEVKQKIKVTVQVKVVSDTGELITEKTIKSKFPLHVLTSTMPGSENNTSLLITNVSHTFNEKHSLALPGRDFFSSVSNNQVSGGWMVVQDHSVLSGNAATNQTLLYEDEAGCYSRTVYASNGILLEDNLALACAPSL